MKITFRTDYDGSIHSTNDAVIAENTISEDGLETGRDIAQHQHQSIFKLLSHKVLYIALPNDKVNDKDYSVVKVFVVRTKECIKVWNVKIGYLYIENKDVIFTTEDEATKYVEKQYQYQTLLTIKEKLESDLQKTVDSIEELGSELGK